MIGPGKETWVTDGGGMAGFAWWVEGVCPKTPSCQGLEMENSENGNGGSVEQSLGVLPKHRREESDGSPE